MYNHLTASKKIFEDRKKSILESIEMCKKRVRDSNDQIGEIRDTIKDTKHDITEYEKEIVLLDGWYASLR